jgi:antitoxin VapB
VTLERHRKLSGKAATTPAEFPEFVLHRREGIVPAVTEMMIEPAPPKSLLALLETLEPGEDEFPPIAELALDPVDL